MGARDEAWITVKRVIERAHIALEVVDSQDPMATRTPELERLTEKMGKKLVIVINKADLIPRPVMDLGRKFLRWSTSQSTSVLEKGLEHATSGEL